MGGAASQDGQPEHARSPAREHDRELQLPMSGIVGLPSPAKTGGGRVQSGLLTSVEHGIESSSMAHPPFDRSAFFQLAAGECFMDSRSAALICQF